MNINIIWIICILVRLLLILLIRLYHKKIKNILLFILFLIGFGFMYKYIFGSNNEIQIGKVYWHETRILHSILYILSGYYLYIDNINLNSIVLLLDIIFSFMYKLYLKL